MKGRIIDPQVKVYGEPDLSSLSVTHLGVGDEVEFMGIRRALKKTWAAVTLADGQTGYLPGETRLFFYQKAYLVQKSVHLYTRPSTLSLVKGTLQKHDQFLVLDVVDRSSKEPWVKIRDLAGVEGYIDGNARIKVIPEVTRATGKRAMLSGGLWCLCGVLIATGIIHASVNIGSLIITWGTIIYGTYQFIRGFYQFWRAPY